MKKWAAHFLGAQVDVFSNVLSHQLSKTQIYSVYYLKVAISKIFI